MKFTVATPSFNQLDWLRLCIASVADQARCKCERSEVEDGMREKAERGRGFRIKDSGLREERKDSGWQMAEAELAVEHIVQDAGTQGIEELARELSTPSSNILHQTSKTPSTNSYLLEFFSEPDAGMYDAINKAWRRAKGDIISYLNTDEQYLPGTLAKVAQFFEEHPDVDLVFGDALVVGRTGEPLAYRRAVEPSATHTRVVHLGVMSCTMFFRRSWLDRGFFFDPQYRAIGDAELVWRMLRAGARVGMIREPLATFAITGQNLGANPKALAEAAAWRHAAPLWQRAAAPFLRLENWTRKALAGAYAKHDVETAIYTPASPSKRVAVCASRLGHRWPG